MDKSSKLSLDEIILIAEKIKKWDKIDDDTFSGDIESVKINLGIYSTDFRAKEVGGDGIHYKKCYIEAYSTFISPPLFLGESKDKCVEVMYDCVQENYKKRQVKLNLKKRLETECFKLAREIISSD